MSASTETSPLLLAHSEPAEEPAEAPSADVQLEANHGAPLVAQNHQRAIKIIKILLFATLIAATGFAVSSLLMCRISVFSHPYLLEFLGVFVLMVCLAIHRLHIYVGSLALMLGMSHRSPWLSFYRALT